MQHGIPDLILDRASVVAGGVLLVALGYVLPHVTSPGLPGDEAAYEKWVTQFASGLGDRPAVVILEPDALAQLDSCLNSAQQQERLQMLSYAVKTLQTSNDQVYLDAGHSNWIPAAQMATRLKAAGIAGAAGIVGHSYGARRQNPGRICGRSSCSALGP